MNVLVFLLTATSDGGTPAVESVNLLGWVSTILGTIATLGGGAMIIWGNKTKKYSDSRDDKTAEVQNFKTQVDSIISISQEVRENAKDTIAAFKDSLNLARQQLESANVTIQAQMTTISTLERIIDGLRQDQVQERTEASEQLNLLKGQLNIQTEERNNYAIRVTELEAKLHEREATMDQTIIAPA